MSCRDIALLFGLTTGPVKFLAKLSSAQRSAMKERKTAQIVTRVTEADRAWVDQEADKQGLDASSFIRMTLRRARVASAEHPTAPQAA
jgi:hypothetical protein